MKRLFRILLPPLVLLGGIAVAASLIATGPEAKRQRPQTPPPTVEILSLTPQSYQVRVPSRGTLAPRTRSSLVAEVAGKVVSISDSFRDGGFFSAGSELLRIDPRDFENALVVARAEVAQRKLALAEEQARADQAQTDWQKLKLTGQPAPLLLRAPQLENAAAALAAAEARLRQAEIDLERTRVLAPYAGRILAKKVDIGQFVSRGTLLADIYASDTVEVRLPLNDEQLRYLRLPEESPAGAGKAEATPVLFDVRSGGRSYQWQGRLVRTEGSFDTGSRQLFVVARIDNPYEQNGERPPLKIGQHVEAQIFGAQLDGVFLLPRTAVRGESSVLLVDAENRLQRRDLEIIWRDEEQVVARSPLQAGERISLTPLPFAADGSLVKIAGEKPAEPKQ